MSSTRKCWHSRYKQEAQKKKKKTDFHWRKGACQTPHCCYKSTPVLTSCVDNIPTVCAPRPLFSLLRLLVGLQPKHGPLFIGSLHISIVVASPADQLRLSAKQRQHVVVSCRKRSRATLVTSPSLDCNRRYFTRLEGNPPPLFTHVSVSFPHLESTNHTDYSCCSGHLNTRAAPGVTPVTSEHFTRLVFNVLFPSSL